jgi:alpha-galactosidase
VRANPRALAFACRPTPAAKGQPLRVFSSTQRGALYRLISPAQDSERSVTEHVARDRGSAVVFAFLHSSHELYPFPRLYLRGLSETATYRIRSLEGKLSENTMSAASGAYWMQHGVDVELGGDFQAAAFTLERVESGAGQP